MKLVLTILFLGNLALYGQSRDKLYKYAYRLDLPSMEAYHYSESKPINWQDTGTSFMNYWDTIKYDVTLLSLDNELKPTYTFNVSLLNSEKEVIQTFENHTLIDSMQIKWSPKTSYVVFDANFRKDTVFCYLSGSQVPTRITLISGSDNELTIPILRCQRRLTPLEMQEVYDAIRFRREAEITKCGICKLMFEI